MSTVDPLQALQAALTVPANSQQQIDLLIALRATLETHQAPIPILVSTFISVVVNQEDSTFKRWIIELLQFALCRSTLSLDAKTDLSSQTLDALAHLINDRNNAIIKLAIQCFSAAYPLLFRQSCVKRNNPNAWNTISHLKSRVIELAWADTANMGVRLSAVKFVQRAILVQTRGASDPRLQNRNDPNLSFCPSDHPFISITQLEAEGQKLLEAVLTILYSSKNYDILTALLNSWVMVTKLRPTLLQVIVPALCQWTPQALVNLPASVVKSVEKAVRILLIHISRIPGNSAYIPQINEALAQQGLRMDRAYVEEKKRKAAIASDGRKRPPVNGLATDQPSDAKRPKLEDSSAVANNASTSMASLASFDFTSLPAVLITDIIVANLEAFMESVLVERVTAYSQSMGLTAVGAAETTTTVEPDNAIKQTHALATEPAHVEPTLVKEEPVDPLQMDIDEDEMEFEPDRLNDALSGGVEEEAESEEAPAVESLGLRLADFKLPPPKELSEDERAILLRNTAKRIWSEAEAEGDGAVTSESGAAVDMWMLLLVRMITRVATPPKVEEEGNKREAEIEENALNYFERQDRLRQTLCDYLMADFPARIRLATLWMNEEWYNDRIQTEKDRGWRPNYDTWLNQIVATYQTHLESKDRTFERFLLDLPYVPADVLQLLREMCLDGDRVTVGFHTLRGFVSQRPSLRAEALTILLELTTHPDKATRTPAINAVKQYVPNVQPMDGMVRDFALQLLRKLQSPAQPDSLKHSIPSTPVNEDTKTGSLQVDDDVSMEVPVTAETEQSVEEEEEEDEDGQLPAADLVQTPYLPDRIELPAKKDHVLQHVELFFALCVKVTDFLDEIFIAYGQMDATVQEAIQQLITQLIRSLGSSHGKLLTLVRNCPPGSESLALRVLTIFTEHGRPSSQLVSLVKGLISERDLDPKFLIPIIAEMDKADIIKHLPRIVSILNGQPEQKTLVRSVFSSIVATPPHTFGAVSSNVPRVRQSELLSPAELMVLLHDSEKEIGLKSAIEAIGICFSMSDVFRSEILAVVMQQIMDEPVLPVLFLRTVIQAVTTYKSLVGFVSTTLLSRLITKKIWTNPPLWEGFIRCAKVIAPASFGALLQLPKDQLRELVDKQPSLKSGLRDYVTKKAGNKARAVASFLDIFGDDGDGQVSSNPATPTPSMPPETPPAGAESAA